MLIVMGAHATAIDCQRVCNRIEQLGYRSHRVSGDQRTAIAVIGNTEPIDPRQFEGLIGVIETIRVSRPFKLVSREVRPENSLVCIGNVHVGGPFPVFCGGPCSVETRDQILEAARAVKAAGGHLLRGGAYKPRTSPYAFQGLGRQALELLSEARAETGLGIVTEAIDLETFDLVERYADCVQIGARNMQNTSLLHRAGRSHLPIVLKRGMCATAEEFLMAAEYIVSGGNSQVILCERGIRTFADHTRNTLDLSIIPTVQRLSHLPIIVDPSHGTGRREYVYPMALAAIAAGAMGLLIEVHPNPDTALSDGFQTLSPVQFQRLIRDATAIGELRAREMSAPVALA